MTSIIDKNFRLHASLIPAQTRGMQVFQSESLVYIDSGLSCDTFNILHIFNGQSLIEAELAEALHYFKSRQLDYCIWINTENLTPEVQQCFEKLGISQKEEEVGMVMNLRNYQTEHSTKQQNIKVVTTPEQLRDYAQVISSHWTPPDQNVLDYYQATAEHYLNPENRTKLLVYYYKGHPVATAELFPTDRKTVGIYGLATLADYRGLGIGSAMMTVALNMVRTSLYDQVVLQASAEGLGIYQRLGFEAYTTYYEFA